jgi:hypothetical protein
MIFFRIVWGIAIIVALIGVAFFFIGLADGSVSSFNIALWMAVLAGLAAVVFGSRALSKKGRLVAAFRAGGIARAAGIALCAVHACRGDERYALELMRPCRTCHD